MIIIDIPIKTQGFFTPGPKGTRREAFDVCLFTGYYGVKMAAQLGFVLVYQAGWGLWLVGISQ